MSDVAALAPERLAWLLRPDLRQKFGAGEALPPPRFRVWWLTEGRREYPAWREPAAGNDAELLAPLPDWPRCGRFGMSHVLAFLLEQRDDLRREFDVATQPGLWHAIAWLFMHGLREYELMDLVDAQTRAALDETPPFLAPQEAAGPRQPRLTWLMFFVWRCGAELQAEFDLRSPRGQSAYLLWFLFEGVPNLQLAPLLAPRWRAWLREPLALQTLPGPTVPRAALLLWQRRGDLQQAFDLRRAPGWPALAAWAREAWHTEPGLRWMAQDAAPAPARETAPGPARPFGVNLIGFAFGELGIGEDVRMAVAACEAAGIPFKVVNVDPGARLRQADDALRDHVAAAGAEQGAAADAPYAVNLFCLTGFDTVRAYLERGRALFGGRCNIGWWPWELPVWPREWRVAFDLVDEVWAATHFTRAMYAAGQRDAVPPAPTAAQAPCPVTWMPLPASVARVTPVTRRRLGLPARRFLFLYVFDFNSHLARKNPLAAVQAFRRAFPAADASVGLVLKTMNSDPQNPAWRRFLRACARDPRIVVLDRTLDRGEVLGLIDACDAYVSLHRAEGFGRTLAEAMLFGKPVVATDFSGSADFLTAATGFPVRWTRRALQPGDYPFVVEADAAWWAQPDVADAARQMRAARAAAADGLFAQRVRRFAAGQFSPARIGQLMRERLRYLARRHAAAPRL